LYKGENSIFVFHKKKNVSYDYENKFLKNWITLGESDARAERRRNKEQRGLEDRIKCDTDDEVTTNGKIEKKQKNSRSGHLTSASATDEETEPHIEIKRKKKEM